MVTIKRPVARQKNRLRMADAGIFVAAVISQILFILFIFGSPSAFNSSSIGGPFSSIGSSLTDPFFPRSEDVMKPSLNEHEKQVNAHLGTHSTGTSFFADYIYDRENPAFRDESVPNWEESAEKVTALLNLDEGSLRSCQYLSDDHQIRTQSKCSKQGTEIVAYNSAAFPRTWCGVTILPLSAQIMTSICQESVHLFPVQYIPISGKQMPSIVVKGDRYGNGEFTVVDCDINCKCDEKAAQSSEMFIEGTNWRIVQALGDAKEVERSAYREDIYYSTSSFLSSVPLTSFSFEKFKIFTPAVKWQDVLSSGSYLIDEPCVTQSRRQRWMESVSTRNQVSSYGKCGHNTELPSGKSLQMKDDRLEILRKHIFNLAFEEGNGRDHITDIVFEAFESGTLPVVLGASNVKDHFPEHSFISAGDFSSWDKLAEFLKEVTTDKDKWESYHKWRDDPQAKDAFHRLYNFTLTPPMCRMCRWAYAKKYGLGWNHEQQRVQETVVPRKMCIDKEEQLLTQPFLESWHTFKDGTYEEKFSVGIANSGNCNDKPVPVNAFNKLGLSVNRQVAEHDGVVDLTISRATTMDKDSDIVLRLKFPMKNKRGSYFQDVHTLVPNVRGALVSSVAIQDSKSKVTVLASWDTKMLSPSEGIIEITVQRSGAQGFHLDERRKIRVIVEDLTPVHDKVTEFFPSSFGKLMTQDFVDPLEIFYVESP